ncbi:MAG TPA: Gfo/Idh/MocA family oxidoreductase [Anaerolineaceae bacterium]|nr:Gfo/Idh/MocA family oxidoreductase [Anaerolineaceae bacterium]
MDFSVGVVGTGLMGIAHTNALRWNDVHVEGVLGSSEDKSRKFADDFNIPRIYHTFEEMLEDPKLDVIHLTTPNQLHYPHAKAALLAGKHVVCEKPLTMTAKESGELLILSRDKQLVTTVNFNVRMYEMVQKARMMVLNGEIGNPYFIHGSYLQDWLLYPSDWNWRLNPQFGGRLRTVGDIGSHWIDLISYISGLKVLEVMADFKTIHPQRLDEEGQKVTIDTEDYATIMVHLEGGVSGVVTLSQMCAGHKNRIAFEMNASQSSLAWNGEKADELWIGHREKANEVLHQENKKETKNLKGEMEAFPDTFNELYRRVYQYLEAGDYQTKPDFPTFEDGHYGMLVLEAIEKSFEEKAWVQVELNE